MAWSFGDGFDLYAVPADMLNGYWDAASQRPDLMGLTTGRFTDSRAFSLGSSAATLIKTSGVNDAVHHFAFGLFQTSSFPGSSSNLISLTLYDGATAQCTIMTRQDGIILLQAGGPGGTTLATYSAAFSLALTWYHFEIEIVINNTTGSFKVRKNGNPVEDFTATGLNTRVSANNYANKIQFGLNFTGNPTHVIDDFFWRSDASSVAWLGDIRCYTRMPVSDANTTFSHSPSAPRTVTPGGSDIGASSWGANTMQMSPFTAPYSGTIGSLTFTTGAASTSHVKFAIYDSTRTTPLGTSSNELTNPINGINTITFPTPVPVTKGLVYYVARNNDATTNFMQVSGGGTLYTATVTYASFPTTGPFNSAAGNTLQYSVIITLSGANAEYVQEAQQNALTDYVYSSNPGDADLYNIASIAPTAAGVVAVTTRSYLQKSDAGTRTATVQVKTGATTAASPTLILTTSGWQWAWRTDLTDPNTGSAWTLTAANNMQIGPKVIA